MRRFLPAKVLAIALAAGVASGCQSYSFNPVTRCLIQPGSQRVSIEDVSTADVLFVVDDSGSMAGEQTKLGDAFETFITSLAGYNDRRVQGGLAPFDFHIAVTTTSVFYNANAFATCQTSCGTATNVCCDDASGQPMRVAKTCPLGTGCNAGAGFSCKTTCQGRVGEDMCCDSAGTTFETTTVACTSPGAACGDIQTRYVFPQKPMACTSSSNCSSVAPYDTCTAATQRCGNYVGSKMCCDVKECATSADCNTGYQCVLSPATCEGRSNVCCATSGGYPQGTPKLVDDCVPGVAERGALYPRGGFVGLSTNPRVLHFDKKLFGKQRTDGSGLWDPVLNGTNNQGFTRDDLKAFFAQNVQVGTCGSGQEQGLQAARLAFSKALAGKQYDRRNGAGQSVPAPGVKADWPHDGAKLVVVYVGDEDDCSAPEDPARGVVMVKQYAGDDSCVDDAKLDVALQKEFRIADIVHDLEALGRPVSAAFVVSASRATCIDDTCMAGTCPDCTCTLANGCHSTTCGGQAPGTRLLEMASTLRNSGVDVIAASICDPGAIACSVDDPCSGGATCVSGCGGALGEYCCDISGHLVGSGGFGPILARIAEIVKPPSALLLPTQPATAEVVRLKITRADGSPPKVCYGPAPEALSFAQAHDQGYDWWFTAAREQITDLDKDPSDASRFIYINHDTNNCEPNPGDSYVADYMGVIPSNGCVTDQDCKDTLQGCIEGDDCPEGAAKYTCFAGLDDTGVCKVATTEQRGTCVCGLRSTASDGQPPVCPKG